MKKYRERYRGFYGMNILLMNVLILSIAGGIAKILGGVLYGSRSVFVDALTSIANTIALIATIYFFKKSLTPPDLDHHYGHHRLAYGGPMVTLVVYSFVAGIATVKLVYVEPYSVSLYAPICAAIGFGLYLGAIVLSQRIGHVFQTYASFTVSELIESGTTIATSFAGAVFSYIIDYLGAVALVAYLFKELYEQMRSLIFSLSDAVPRDAIEIVKYELQKRGLKDYRVRLRRIFHNIYHGDIVIKLPSNITLSEAHKLADDIEKTLRERYGIDVIVHLEPIDSNTRS